MVIKWCFLETKQLVHWPCYPAKDETWFQLFLSFSLIFFSFNWMMGFSCLCVCRNQQSWWNSTFYKRDLGFYEPFIFLFTKACWVSEASASSNGKSNYPSKDLPTVSLKNIKGETHSTYSKRPSTQEWIKWIKKNILLCVSGQTLLHGKDMLPIKFYQAMGVGGQGDVYNLVLVDMLSVRLLDLKNKARM